MALIADLFASKRVNQKLTSKKETKPTPSHPKNICKRLPDVTKKSIKKIKLVNQVKNLFKWGSVSIYSKE